jgi:methyl-accepting chemotaxis protein
VPPRRPGLRPRSTTVLGRAQAGDFSGRITESLAEPALEQIKTRVNSLLAAVEDGLGRMLPFLDALSRGDLTARVDGDLHGAFARLQEDANSAATRMAETIAQIAERPTTPRSARPS